MTHSVVIGGYRVTVADLLRDACVATFVILPALIVLFSLTVAAVPE
jgi:hypothetical protein